MYGVAGMKRRKYMQQFRRYHFCSRTPYPRGEGNWFVCRHHKSRKNADWTPENERSQRTPDLERLCQKKDDRDQCHRSGFFQDAAFTAAFLSPLTALLREALHAAYTAGPEAFDGRAVGEGTL